MLSKSISDAVKTYAGRGRVDQKDDLEVNLIQSDLGRTIVNESIIPTEVNTSEISLNGIDKKNLVLRPVDFQFSQALQKLHTITKDYAYAPLELCFNWDEVAKEAGDDEGDWFVVVFRSIRNDLADSKKLYDADRMAHEEAKKSGGLLKYWYGDLNEHRECLAMCIWANRRFARLATTKPLHLQAVKLASVMYDTYDLERYSIVKNKGESYLYINRL